MANYARRYAIDVGGEARIDAPPPFIALNTYMRENAVASSVISLNPNTVDVEVSSVGQQSNSGLVIRWIPLTETAAAAGAKASVIASGLSANFDHYIPGNTTRRFVVPKETIGQTAGGQIGSVNGLYQRLAWINAGTVASSILANEY